MSKFNTHNYLSLALPGSSMFMNQNTCYPHPIHTPFTFCSYAVKHGWLIKELSPTVLFVVFELAAHDVILT